MSMDNLKKAKEKLEEAQKMAKDNPVESLALAFSTLGILLVNDMIEAETEDGDEEESQEAAANDSDKEKTARALPNC